MNITVLYNQPTDKFSEADSDTLFSVQEIAESLDKSGYDVSLMGLAKDELKKVNEIKSDLVFNLVEWSGKEYQYGVEAIRLMEKKGIPFTGSDSRGYNLTCDKVLMKKLMQKYHIPTPEYQIFMNGDEPVDTKLRYPAIIKPAYEHCSIGLTKNSVVENESELRKQVLVVLDTYRQPVIAEEFIEGKEIQVTLLERSNKPMALPPIEVVYRNNENNKNILTYDCKWRENSEDYQAATIGKADLDKDIFKKVVKTAQICFEKLGGRDYPRVDMRIQNGRIFVLEINNNPGIGDDEESCIGYSAKLLNLDFDKLLVHVVENAVWRWKGSYASMAI